MSYLWAGIFVDVYAGYTLRFFGVGISLLLAVVTYYGTGAAVAALNSGMYQVRKTPRWPRSWANFSLL